MSNKINLCVSKAQVYLKGRKINQSHVLWHEVHIYLYIKGGRGMSAEIYV